MKRILIIFFGLILLINAQSKVGSTAAPFLTIGIGPRAIAMGNAFVATSDDITALYWNPAGITRIGGNSAMFNRTSWIADINYNWAGAAVQLGDLGTIGLSVNQLDYGKMAVTTNAEQDGTGEYFSAQDISIGLSYAYQLTDRFSIGGTAKYIQQKIYNSSASALAIDVGMLFNSDLYGLRIGASISNFGTDMTLDGKDLLVQHDIDPTIEGNNYQILAKLRTDGWPLPLTFRIGVAMDVLNLPNNKLTVGIDALHPNDNDETVNIGAEYTLFNLLSLRAGYKSIGMKDAEDGLSLGFGVKYDFAPNLGVFVDYAYQDFGIFTKAQHFAVGVRF